MALNPQFPNWANGANSSLVLTGPYTINGKAFYQLPLALVETGFGAGYVAEGGTDESPTFPEGDYDPNPYIAGAGTISGNPTVGSTLTFTPPTVTGDPAPTVIYDWCYYGIGNALIKKASGLSYTLQPSDLGLLYVVRTTATNTEGSVYTVTVPFGPILGTVPVITNPGAISPASVFPGQTLTVTSIPTATGDPLPTISWNWIQVGGPTPNVPIQLGGTTYVAKQSDAGYAVGIEVTATNSSGSAVGYSPTSAVNNSAPAVVVKPQITINKPYVGVREGGVYGRFRGFPTPQTTDWGFAWQEGNGGAGTVDAINVTSGGTYIWLLGAYRTVSIVGDGVGATARAELNPVGDVMFFTMENFFGGSDPATGTITFTGEGSETPLVVTWTVIPGSGPTFPIDPNPIFTGGQGWTQENIDDCILGAYGTIVYAGDPIVTPGTFQAAVGNAIEQVVMTNNGSGYSTATATVDEDPVEVGIAVPAVLATVVTPGVPITYTPIPGANKTVSYIVSEVDIDKQIVFYQTVTNSVGSLTGYSDPTEVVPENLNILTPAKLFVPAPGYPEVGLTLQGVPATFSPATGVSITNQWSYVQNDGSLVPIGGATSDTYTLQETDTGENLVFVTTGSTTTPTQVISSQSNSSGVVRNNISIVTPPSVTCANPFVYGSTWSIDPGATDPANNLEPSPGPSVVKQVIFYNVDPVKGTREFAGTYVNPTLTQLQSLNAEPINKIISADITYQYNDGFATSSITATVNTPVVTGVAPALTAPGSVSGIYAPNFALTYTPATFSGNPTPTVQWYWINDKNQTLQIGGLRYNLTTQNAGMKIAVIAIATNAVGEARSQTDFVKVVDQEPYFTTQGTLSGPAVIGSGAVINYIPATAYAQNDKPVVTWKWYITYDGQPPVDLNQDGQVQITLRNNNGMYTGGVVTVVATATNKSGTAQATSNPIGPMLGSPRLLSDGAIGLSYDGAGGKFLKIDYPPVFSTIPEANTLSWSVGVPGGVTAFISPTNSARLRPADSFKMASGTYYAQNQYGTSTFNFPEINVGQVV